MSSRQTWWWWPFWPWLTCALMGLGGGWELGVPLWIGNLHLACRHPKPLSLESLKFSFFSDTLKKQRRTCLGGGWANPSENYEFVSWDDEIPNIWKVIKFHGSKPPTRCWYINIAIQIHQADPNSNFGASVSDYPLVNINKKLLKPWPSRNSGFTQLEHGGSFHWKWWSGINH